MLHFADMDPLSDDTPHSNLFAGSLSIITKLVFVLFVIAVVVIGTVGYLHAIESQQTHAPVTTPTATATTTPSTPAVAQVAPLTPASVTFSSGKTITLDIPQGYSIDVAADGFRSMRFMAWSPDHRLFVGEMANASDTHTGRVIILDNFNPETGTFSGVHTYLDNLRNPNSVAFYQDPQGNEWIYVALTDELVRYPYNDGDDAPTTAPQVIATFPDFGEPASEGGWHLTRTLAFDGDNLYVSVGSGCNSCEEPGEETNVVRADILEMNPDGSDSRVIASGLRNAVGIIYADGALYATANEVDQLGADRPDDLLYKIQDGADYGWPYCYEYDGAVYPDTTTAWKTPIDCSQVPLAYAELGPHTAPLGLAYFDDTFADPALHDAFLVAEHGSGDPSIGNGYMVSLVRSGSVTPFITGFLQNSVRQGRPVDILQNDDNSFFLTDDFNGAVYYLRYTAGS